MRYQARRGRVGRQGGTSVTVLDEVLAANATYAANSATRAALRCRRRASSRS